MESHIIWVFELPMFQVLLDLARMIFEEQSTIEHMVFRILTHTQSLIQCQRVQVNEKYSVSECYISVVTVVSGGSRSQS